MYAAIYVRVSTEEQAEKGFSIDVQKERLLAYCKSQGWDNAKIYIDDGYTGTNLDRPAMKRMIRHIEDKKIHTVVVYKLDRLSRKQKDVLKLLEDVFEPNNVVFKSATEPFETSTAFGKAMIGVLAVFAQLERDMIVERTTVGRRKKISNGIWSGGRVPFGYRWNKDLQKFEIVPEEAWIVKEIFRRYLLGHSRLSIAEWAADRTNERTIDHSTIRDMIARPVYKGDLVNSDQVYIGSHEPIIEPEIWEAAQREAIKRKEGVSPLGEYLLTGLLKCGICGGSIVHVHRRDKKNGKEYIYNYYTCKNQHVRKKDSTNNCSLNYIHRDKIEKFVIEQIKSLSLYPEKVREILESNDDDQEIEYSETSIKERIQRIETDLENLYDAIQSGDIKASSVSGRIRKLEEEKELLENDLDELSLNNYTSNISKNEFKSAVNDISSAWDYMTEDEQKAAIRRLITTVILQKDSDPIIEWNFL